MTKLVEAEVAGLYEEVEVEVDEFGFTPEEKQQAKDNMGLNLQLMAETIAGLAMTHLSPPFHAEIYKAWLEALTPKGRKKILTVAPRYHAKSTVAGLFLVLHHIFYRKGPKVVVIVSRTASHSVRVLNTVKEALDGEGSETLKYFYGDHGPHTAIKWTESEVQLSDGTLIVALGTGQQIRGIKHGYQRPTFILLDDPEDEENTKTIDSMNQNFEWVVGAAIPALAVDGIMVVIGTVLHQYCIVRRLKKAEKQWTVLWYQAIVDEAKKLTLWPDLWPYEAIMDKKNEARALGKLSTWYREWMNMIVAPEHQPFQEHMWKTRWGGEVKNYKDERYAEIRVEQDGSWWWIPVFLYMGIDPARSKEETADFSAIRIIGKDAEDHVWSIYTWKARVYPMELAAKIMEVSKEYAIRGINIETVGYQEMLRDYLKHQKLWLPGIERKNQPRTAKNDRLLGNQPRYSQGGVTLRENGDEPLIDEMVVFDPSKKNNIDDCMDADWYALKDAHKCPYPKRLTSIPRPEKQGVRKKRKIRIGGWQA